MQGSEYRDQMVYQCNPTYVGMIETMDENVGRLMAKLDELGIADNTLVIFTSDNGGLNQHNFGNSVPVTSNAPLRSGKGWLYEGAVRGPGSSIRSGNWKLIEWLENGDVELFDLANDESEKKNLAASNPLKAEEMLRKLRDWRAEVGANMLR